MTIIVIRGNVLAADSGLWEDNSLITDTFQKVFRCRWGVMATFNHSGYMPAAIKAMNEAETIPDRLDLGHDTDIVFLGNDGRIRLYKADYMMEIDLPFWALGSASPVAFGALHAGADAVTACQIAIKVGPWAAGEVQALSVSNETVIEEPEIVEFDPNLRWDSAEEPETADDTPKWRRERGL